MLLSIVFFITGCSDKKTPDDACQAAETYYGYLIRGDVDAYMRGLHEYDSLSDEYRSQLRDMFLQYLEHERQLRGGLTEAHALRDTLIDSLSAHVFVEVVFGDSTREEVSLPLVRTVDGWRMK